MKCLIVKNAPYKNTPKRSTPTSTPPLPSQKPAYDQIADKPPPAIITPSYVPLHKKNEHWGDPCQPVIFCEGLEFIRLHSQNNNGISDSTGLKYDDTFKHMKEADAAIFSVNETHADKMNVKNNTVIEKS